MSAGLAGNENLTAFLGAVFTGALVFFVTVGVQWLVYDRLLHDPGSIRLIGPVIAALVAGAFAYDVRRAEMRRKEATLARLQLIADLNHHIRNALQAITYSAYASKGDETRVIRHAVDRIEWVLREVLPGIEPVGAPGDSRPPGQVVVPPKK